VSQFEQENDVGRGGGYVNEVTAGEAWRESDRRRLAEPTDPETGMPREPDPPDGGRG
jgi:hypothetical protein